MGLFFLYHQIQRPNLKTEKDLIEIKGKIVDYSFTREIGYRATLKKYYIWLDQYPCTFQIKADFLPFFSEYRFKKAVKRGDRIKLTIPKEYNLMKKNEYLFITSLSKLNEQFLKKENTLEKENDNFDIYAGFLFIIGGLIYYALKRNGIIK